eukprot:Hpha_TRINITY_DN15747_c1_g6::TRINITY_DN15747_c1_g6_i1::g.36425::m.36425
MLRQSRAALVAPRSVGDYGRGGRFGTIFGAFTPPKPKDPERLPYDAERMQPGVDYAPAGPRSIARVQRNIPDRLHVSSMVGLTDKMIPHDLLDINMVFKTIEPGNIVPQPYLSELTEPVSADPEKHPVPTFFWIHKWNKIDAPSSYGLVPEEDFRTEGKDRNPFSELGRNPGVYNRRQAMRLGATKAGGSLRKAAMNPGYKRPNRELWRHRLGTSPWWYKAEVASLRVEGRSRIDDGKHPTFAYYKFLPILGWSGWGTKAGEITVENKYTEVGLDQLQWWVDTGLLNPNETITPNTLIEARVIDDYHWPGLKLVANKCTWLQSALDIDLEMADPEAIKLVEKVGGSVTTRWRDHEAVIKEKVPWRFPVIQSPPLPPAELMEKVYATEEHRGYLSGFYEKVLRAPTKAPREWSMLEEAPIDIGEVPPYEKEGPPQAQAIKRAPVQVSLVRKQRYWEDFLAGTAGEAGTATGIMTPNPLPVWEYTYFKKRGYGTPKKFTPPAGEETITFPGFPMRDYKFWDTHPSEWKGRGKQEQDMAKRGGVAGSETPYETTEMDVVTVEKQMSWEAKGEGWRTKEDAEVRYRNPYNNPFLQERIKKWQELEARKKKAKMGGKK